MLGIVGLGLLPDLDIGLCIRSVLGIVGLGLVLVIDTGHCPVSMSCGQCIRYVLDTGLGYV